MAICQSVDPLTKGAHLQLGRPTQQDVSATHSSIEPLAPTKCCEIVQLHNLAFLADDKGREWRQIWEDPEWCEKLAEAVRG
ncbi:hypothetical protein EV426DRAFT_717628 [Tirmania nivea]|nr:hypothetical protein EV426DRAFT_717628 [Tirmania nivea]